MSTFGFLNPKYIKSSHFKEYEIESDKIFENSRMRIVDLLKHLLVILSLLKMQVHEYSKFVKIMIEKNINASNKSS